MPLNISLNGLSAETMVEKNVLSLGTIENDETGTSFSIITARRLRIGKEFDRFRNSLEEILHAPVELDVLYVHPELRHVYEEIHQLLRKAMEESNKRPRRMRTKKRSIIGASAKQDLQQPTDPAQNFFNNHVSEWMRLVWELDSFAVHRDVTPYE